MIKVYIDFETYSETDIKKGAWAYSKHPSTEVLCLAYAIGDREPEIIQWPEHSIKIAQDGCPYTMVDPYLIRLLDLIKDPDTLFIAHNASFEYSIWANKLVPAGWPEIPIRRWECTAAKAAICALPRSLDKCASALGLEHNKDKEGQLVMRKLCQPRKPTKNNPNTRYPYIEHLSLYRKLYEYCKQDVRVEREIDKILPSLGLTERKIWELDLKINTRGVNFDTKTVNNACDLLDENERVLTEDLKRVTQYKITSFGQVAAIKDFLGSADTTAETLKTYLEKKYYQNQEQKRVVEIRLALANISIKKLNYIQNTVDDTGKLYNNLLYCGAATGRWSGVGVQLQNLPRNVAKNYTTIIDTINLKDLDFCNMVFGELTHALKSVIRCMIVPSDKRKKLYVADFASIEARVLAWLVDDPVLLPAFQRNEDIYIEMASRIYRKPKEEIANPSLERQLGKQTILGCGYGMGVAKFLITCKTYGIDIEEPMAELAVNTYRSSYPTVPQFWKDINNAVIQAIHCKGEVFTIGKIKAKCEGMFLMVKLPSGRCLYYPYPSIREESKRINKGKENFEMTSLSIYYYTQNSKTRKWEETYTYGGKLTENIVQAIARDLMAEAMLCIEAAGYDVLFTVHDEVVGEHEDGSVEEFNSLMLQVPKWALGCPIGAETKELERYGK